MAGSGSPALSQGVGYGIVLGVGLAFAVFMVSDPSSITSVFLEYLIQEDPLDLLPILITYLHTNP